MKALSRNKEEKYLALNVDIRPVQSHSVLQKRKRYIFTQQLLNIFSIELLGERKEIRRCSLPILTDKYSIIWKLQ